MSVSWLLKSLSEIKLVKVKGKIMVLKVKEERWTESRKELKIPYLGTHIMLMSTRIVSLPSCRLSQAAGRRSKLIDIVSISDIRYAVGRNLKHDTCADALLDSAVASNLVACREPERYFECHNGTDLTLIRGLLSLQLYVHMYAKLPLDAG